MGIGYGEAFGGGLISLYSPCVGIVAPAFLAHLAGILVLAPPGRRRLYEPPVVLGTLAFVLGFAVVFVLLGSALGGVSSWLRESQTAISRAGGSLVMLSGLAATGLVPVPAPARPGPRLALDAGRYLLSLSVGVAFAIGWTPCVNRQLGEILNLSQDAASAGQGARLLSVYSGGLMAPFFLAGTVGALAGPRLLGGPWARRIAAVLAGVALMALGALVFTERFAEVTGYLFALAL